MPNPLFKKNNLSSQWIIVTIYAISTGIFLKLLQRSFTDNFILSNQISEQQLISHCAIILSSFLVCFFIVELIFIHVRTRRQSSHSFVLIKTCLQTGLVALSLYAHIFYIKHFLKNFTHYQALLDFLNSQACVLITLSFVLALLMYLILFIIQTMGVHTIINILTNRYQTPTKTSKIIMYLDLNDSTPLNERLGDKQYLRLKQDFFKTISEAVYLSAATLYQYQGIANIT